MKHEDSSPCSQQPAIGTYPETDEYEYKYRISSSITRQIANISLKVTELNKD